MLDATDQLTFTFLHFGDAVFSRIQYLVSEYRVLNVTQNTEKSSFGV